MNNIFSLIMLAGVFVAACSQILLKRAAGRKYRSFFAEYLNPLVVGAYGLFVAAAFASMLALRFIPLSLAPILEAAGYIFVAVLGWFFLGERLSRRQIFGMVLIVVGIVVYSV